MNVCLCSLNQSNCFLPVCYFGLFKCNHTGSFKIKVVHCSPLISSVLDANAMPKDEEYEKGCVKGNMVYKIHWTEPPTLMAVESMCGHIPQVSILDTKEVIYSRVVLT